MPASHPVPLKVFLAEDSAAIRERIAANLSGHGMDVVGAAQTPVACIDGILSSHPDVVVLDVHLEGGSGLQVMRGVRGERGIAAAFVVFSSAIEPVYRKRYLAEGAAFFLDKNSELDSLAGAVEAASHHTAH